MQLYTFSRSSAAYRTRIALNLKGLPYEPISIHLQKEGGLNRKPEYRAINALMRVPALRLDSGELLTQSIAIIEYLDEIHPQPPLLPRDALKRAQVRAMTQLIACDIHPLNNVSPLRYLKNELGQEIDRHKIVLERPIKDTGEHEVTIKLHHNVSAQFKFDVKSAEEPKSEETSAEHPEKKHRSFFRRKKETK